MGLESATYVNDFVTTNPVAGDNVSQGDDHLRLLKAVLKTSFPNITRPIYLEQDRVDLASATTPDLSTPASNYINITGTTQIDGFATEPAGFARLVRFDGILTLNYNVTSFILITGDDIITAADDHAVFMSLGSGNWRMIAYSRANGRALAVATLADATESAAGIVEMATEAEIYAATAGAKALMAQDLSTASAPVALTDAATIALDWVAGINRAVTLSANRAMGNPTNGIPGTWRRVEFTQDGTGGRTITWGNQYVHPGGVDAVLSTAAGAIDTVYIYCRTSSIFEVHVGGKAWAT